MHGFEALDYCHDSAVSKIIVETVNDERKIRIMATFSYDTGCVDYDDKSFVISFDYILLCRHTICGRCAGDELIGGVDYQVSNDMLNKINSLVRKGMKEPKYYITIAFISGSKMEVACDFMDVSIV